MLRNNKYYKITTVFTGKILDTSLVEGLRCSKWRLQACRSARNVPRDSDQLLNWAELTLILCEGDQGLSLQLTGD